MGEEAKARVGSSGSCLPLWEGFSISFPFETAPTNGPITVEMVFPEETPITEIICSDPDGNPATLPVG